MIHKFESAENYLKLLYFFANKSITFHLEKFMIPQKFPNSAILNK